MTIRTKQLVAAVLAVIAAFVGGWAALAPAAFYRSFPLPGRHWISALGPYNEHLTRDVGGLFLALFVLSAWAAVRPRPETFRATGATWLIFNAIHLASHVGHLDPFGLGDQIANVVLLAASLLLSALLLVPERRSAASTDRRSAAASERSSAAAD